MRRCDDATMRRCDDAPLVSGACLVAINHRQT
jgi:hypothetical protein